MDEGLTTYSEEIPGDDGNYKWPARFDYTDGSYLGITQRGDAPDESQRVLLSRQQVRELLTFIGSNRE